MYDILQLNDMLVPELLDIAEDLKIENAKKLDKQGLIYKILDKQAVAPGQDQKGSSDKPKRKRIVKATTANSTEEAEVEEQAPVVENKRPMKKAHPKKEDKHKKQPKRKEDEGDEEGSQQPTEEQSSNEVNESFVSQ